MKTNPRNGNPANTGSCCLMGATSCVAQAAAFLIAMALAAPVPAGAQCVLPPPGLVSWWPGDGTAEDIFGGNPAIAMNGESFFVGPYPPGICGRAFGFDGLNDSVVSTSVALTSLKNTFTIEFWALPTANRANTAESTSGTAGTSGQRYAIAPENGGGNGPAGVGISVGTNGISVFEHANSFLPSPLVYTGSLAGWTHIAVVYQDKQPNLYINGALARIGLTSPRASVFPSKTLGNVLNYGPYRGLLDEISVYNRALSPPEIQAIYQAAGAGKCKPPPPLPGTVIYTNDFEDLIIPGWSAADFDMPPVGDRLFLGQFGSETVTLSLTNLPPHTNLNVAFDLLVLQSWDGNNGGPDYWDFGLQGQVSLLHTTFQQYGSRRQAYPGSYPGLDHRNRTGALETDTLGYTSGDSVYHLSFTFPHTNATAVLQFKGSGLGSITDENWGLDNMRVVADAPTVAITSPTNGAAFTAPTNLVLSADAAAVAGDIRQVMFLDNNTLLGFATNSPYSIVWSNVPAGAHLLKVKATDDSGRTSESTVTVVVNGLLGEYFANTSLSGTPAQRLDPAIDFDWATAVPRQGTPANNFSVKWSGTVVPKYSETCTLYTTTDDGVRLWVNGERVIDAWFPNNDVTFSASVPLLAGQRYQVQLDYFEATSSASAVLEWASTSQLREVIPASQLFPPIPGVNRQPNTPVANDPAGNGYAVTPAVDLPISVDFFSDPDTGQSQSAADWEIYTTNPSNLVWYSYGTTGAILLTNRLSNGAFVNSHAGLSGLISNRDYILRVRHEDNSVSTNAWGRWGLRYFNTRPPGIAAQPHPLTVNQMNPIIAGGSIVLGATATNVLPWATYQWQFGGVDLPNATNATLVLTNIQPAQAGNYTVRVANPAGSVVSLPFGLLVDAAFSTLVQSTFETTNEGWTVVREPTSPGLSFVATAGNPGGCIQASSSGTTGGPMYWCAPAAFLGNRAGAYDGYLEFDAYQSTTAYPDHGGSVILTGAGTNLYFDTAYNPATSWTFYRLPLNEVWWRKGSFVGPVATQADLLKVLATLDGLKIRAEFSGTSDTDRLDNVRLLAPACTPATILTMRSMADRFVAIEWPTNACGFVLETAPVPTGNGWSSAGLWMVLTNGLNRVTVSATNPAGFYRLRKP